MTQDDILSLFKSAQEQSKAESNEAAYVSVNSCFDALMLKSGYIKLGSGLYSSVWRRSVDRRIYKINSNINGPSDGFYAWMNACMQVTDNPALPKFGDVVQVGNRYCVELEQLSRQYSVSCNDSLWEFMAKNHDLADAVLLSLKVAANCAKNWCAPVFQGSEISDINLDYITNWLDIHSGNLMSRHGVLVLNDPIAALQDEIYSGVDNGTNATLKAA